MDLKYKVLNKLADTLKKYGSKEYDYVDSCEISGEVKTVFFTTDCTTIKELKDKSYKGLININDILEEEFKNSECYHKEIIFCDSNRVVCFYNSRNDSYYESVHEFFDNAEERTYIKCDSDSIYQAFKNFILQSSKYHKYISYNDEIPYKKVFDKVFSNEKQLIEQNNNTHEKTKIYNNYVVITGNVINISKEFTKIDGEKAKFIEIQQEYEYNNKIKYNKISVMISSDLIKEISNMSKGKNVSIKGRINTYTDKDKNIKSVIKCTEIDILDMYKIVGEIQK